MGKLKSSVNAVKHGSYATRHLLWGEDEELYNAISKEQRKNFKPVSYIEKALVDELVNQLWTLRRLERAQLYYLEDCQQEAIGMYPPQLTMKEKKILEADSAQRDVASNARYAGRVEQKAAGIRKLYETALVYNESGRMERIAASKRIALQTILSIEAELEGRLRRRNATEAKKIS